MNKTVIKTNRNTYLIRYSINAHCEAEEMLGFPITQLDGNAGFSVFRTLLLVGLKYGGRQDMTLDKAGDIMEEIITDKGMEYFSEQVSEAIQKSISRQRNDDFKRQHNVKKNR